MGAVTLQTIADRVGVSRMTVSNAFNRPDQLSTALRDKIIAAADQLGYTGPHPAARALARGTTGTVGVLLTDSLGHAFRDSVATQLMGAIAEELAPTALSLTLLLSKPSTVDVVPARDVPMDGAIVFACDSKSEAVHWLTKRGLPMVFVDQPPTKGFANINVDDRGGAAAAAQHLVDLGHRRVAIVVPASGETASVIDREQLEGTAYVGYSIRQRMSGWTEVCDSNGVTITIVECGRSDERRGHDAGQIVVALRPRPTAVLCYSDAIATGLIDAIDEAGLDVPGDISVIGFDDGPQATHLHPPLTTVRQDSAAKGREAVAALLSAMGAARGESPTRAKPKRVLLPTTLVVRGSTAPPR